jgi:hypothetical protein
VLIAEIDAIAQKRKLRRPQSERELLEEAEEVLRKAREALEKSEAKWQQSAPGHQGTQEMSSPAWRYGQQIEDGNE